MQKRDQRAYSRAYYAEHKEVFRASSQIYYQNNK